MQCGIVAAADRASEWLLPWWHHHLRLHSALPICFVDLGLSPEKRLWCSQNGILLSCVNKSFSVAQPSSLPAATAHAWQTVYGETVWRSRNAWFLKPQALLASPFEIGLWLDLDCEVQKPLDPLFTQLQDKEIALARQAPNDEYNSGVIVFRKNSFLLHKWAEVCLKHNHQFIGDQQALNSLLPAQNQYFQELPQIHNWLAARGYNPNAVIIHWTNEWGKMFIELYGGAQQFLLSILAYDS